MILLGFWSVYLDIIYRILAKMEIAAPEMEFSNFR